MTDLRERFEEFRDVPVPELWDRVTDLAARPEGPRPVRSKLIIAIAATAFALIVIGGPLLMIGLGESTLPTSEPPSTAWGAVPTHDPWGESVVDAVELSGGGFVVVTANPGRVFWSPDGVEWFDADPEQRLAAYVPGTVDGRFEPSGVAAAGEKIVVLDRANAGVWVGEPATGLWTTVRLEPRDTSEGHDLLTIASNDTAVIVVGRARGTDILEDPEFTVQETDGYDVWTLHADTGLQDRVGLPIAAEWSEPAAATATWYDEQWVVALARDVWTGVDGWDTRTSLLMSADGMAWSEAGPFEEFDSLTSLTAGSSTMVATTCDFGGDSFWYSVDATTWVRATSAHFGHGSAYVDGLGFVIRYGTTWVLSVDGRDWQSPAKASVTIAPYQADVGAAALDGDVFVFNNRLWVWSTD